MITKKNVNKLQNAVIKENAANLVGAVKLYNALFANGADLKSICKALEIPAEYAVKVAALAKDKKRLVAVCSQMLPKVDDTFVKYALYSSFSFINHLVLFLVSNDSAVVKPNDLYSLP